MHCFLWLEKSASDAPDHDEGEEVGRGAEGDYRHEDVSLAVLLELRDADGRRRVDEHW